MSDQCQECLNKDKRIRELENLVHRMSESFDRLMAKSEKSKEKIQAATVK